MSENSIRREHARSTANTDEPTTSNNKNEKITTVDAGHFLKTKHPELFEITPIPGGFRRNLATRQNAYQSHDDDSMATDSQAKIPSELNKSLQTESDVDIGEILETTIGCPSPSRPMSKEDRKNNAVIICSVAISTVMMLAQRTYEDITMEHIYHTQEYFRGLKQPDGYPANVGQLMQLLTNLKKSGKIVGSQEEENDDNEENEGHDESHASD